VSVVSAARVLEEDAPELLLPLVGVLNRFKAFASVVPPDWVADAPAPDPLEAAVEALADEADWADDEASAVELAEDDEEPPPEARKVGALEMAVVVAREPDGSEESGP
jgi:hypothetical protein